jgi:hypothetical protein
VACLHRLALVVKGGEVVIDGRARASGIPHLASPSRR